MWHCRWSRPWWRLTKTVGRLGLVGCLLVAPIFEACGQLAVVDAAAVFQLAQNFQQILRLVANSTRDLQTLSDLAAFAHDAADLVEMAQDLIRVYAELDTLRQGWLMLCDPNAIPQTASALYVWMQQAQMWGLHSARGSLMMFTQLMTAVIRSLQAMQRVVGILISRISGSVGGLQSIAGLLQQALGKAELLNVLVLNGQQGLMGPQMIEQVKVLALPAIMAAEMRTWGQP